jgi:hypothetical protein
MRASFTPTYTAFPFPATLSWGTNGNWNAGSESATTMEVGRLPVAGYQSSVVPVIESIV